MFLHFVVTRRFYHPPTKLREGNVFSCVCPSFTDGGCHVTITHDALDITVHVSSWISDLGPTPAKVVLLMTPRATSGGRYRSIYGFKSGWYTSYWNVHGGCYDVTSCYGQHPSGQHPPGQDTMLRTVPPAKDSSPPPHEDSTPIHGQQAAGTHPTGMLSILLLYFVVTWRSYIL